jgi:hypothetical protein
MQRSLAAVRPLAIRLRASISAHDDYDHRKAVDRSLDGRQDDPIEHALYFGL